MSTATETSTEAFRHDALMYSGMRDFLDGVVPFVRDGVAAGEPVLVVVGAPKIASMRTALGPDAEAVQFADMAFVGKNPARIIPAWQDFLDAHGGAGRPVRGIGEPIWAERSPAELVECQRHEGLLNVAFADSPAWQLMCPYDVDALEPAVVAEARRTHPAYVERGRRHPSPEWRGVDAHAAPFDVPLPAPPPGAEEHLFAGPASIRALRRTLTVEAATLGFDERRAADVAVTIGEITANTVRHGGGSGTLLVWREHDDTLVCEVRDGGRISDPLVGRRRASFESPVGRGLWLANQLSDLVQLRAVPDGNVVRVHFRRVD